MGSFENGTLKALEVSFRNGKIRQDFQFRAPVVISRKAIPAIMQSVMAQFKRTIELNKIAAHAWPPDHVEITPHADWMGFDAELGASAQEPGFSVIHKASA